MHIFPTLIENVTFPTGYCTRKNSIKATLGVLYLGAVGLGVSAFYESRACFFFSFSSFLFFSFLPFFFASCHSAISSPAYR